MVDPKDLAIRNTTYGLITVLGRVPSADNLADHVGLGIETVRASWRRLHDSHALVLDANSGEIRMANPFSAVPTTFRVETGNRVWYANCAWDAFGSAPPSGWMGASSRSAPTATTRLLAASSTASLTIPHCCSAARSQRRSGGTTSSSHEAR